VARRIAHEIKNPLTPIQLSAERLRGGSGARSRATWRSSTAAPTPSSARSATSGGWWTSSRLRARCPAPRFAPEDAGELLREAVFARASPRPTSRSAGGAVTAPPSPATGDDRQGWPMC
jgi:two-component system nitrogen regulation sensor histidine kinase NtrY